MKCSIVIRSYNEGEHIGKLLAGIGQQTLIPHEVIVVDSGSTDDTVKIARSFGARIIEIDKREFTFGRALNIGCEAATGDILVFASAHVYPTYRTWLAELCEPFADDRVLLSYGRQRGTDVNKFSEHQIFHKWFPVNSVCPQRSYFCNNANCAIRKSAWLNLRYDEMLTGLEDLAWAKQAQASGGWLAYAGDAEIIHVHDETWSSVRNRYRREAMAMRVIDDKASFSYLDFARLLISNVYADIRQAIRDKCLRAEFESILRFRYNQLWGTYVGYNGPGEASSQLREKFYFPTSKAERKKQKYDQRANERIDYGRLSTQFDTARASDEIEPLTPPEPAAGRQIH